MLRTVDGRRFHVGVRKGGGAAGLQVPDGLGDSGF